MSEQGLWSEVLLTVISDALTGVSETGTPQSRAHSIRAARQYLTRPNRDFNMVCHLAGVDPVATRERLAVQIAQAPSPEELAQIGQRKTTLMVPKIKPITKPRERYTAFGKTLTVTEWSKETGISRSVLSTRLSQLDWPIEQALSVPLDTTNRIGTRRKARRPGVGSDLRRGDGTGAGRSAQETTEIDFSRELAKA